MKLIKKGIVPEERIWKGTCRRCNSEFEAVQSELQNIESCPREHYEFCHASCEVCETGDVILYPVKI